MTEIASLKADIALLQAEVAMLKSNLDTVVRSATDHAAVTSALMDRMSALEARS